MANEAYCLDVGSLAGIVAGTAVGTAVLSFVLMSAFLYAQKRHKKAMRMKNHSRAKLRTCENVHQSESGAVHSNQLNDDQERAVKCGQSTVNSETQCCVDSLILEKEDAGKQHQSNKEANETIQENGECTSDYSSKGDNSLEKSIWDALSDESTVRFSDANEKSKLPKIICLTLNGEELLDSVFSFGEGAEKGIQIQSIRNDKRPEKNFGICEGDSLISIKIDLENISSETFMTIMRLASPCTVILELIKPLHCKVLNPDLFLQSSTLQKSTSLDNVARKTKSLQSPNLENSTALSRCNQFKSLQNLNKIEPDRLNLEVSPEKLVTADQKLEDQSANHNKTEEAKESHVKVPSNDQSSISPLPRKSKIIDPYAGLSAEDRMELIRLSYEDTEISRSTPNLNASPLPPISENTHNEDSTVPELETPKLKAGSKIPVPTASPRKKRTEDAESTANNVSDASTCPNYAKSLRSKVNSNGVHAKNAHNVQTATNPRKKSPSHNKPDKHLTNGRSSRYVTSLERELGKEQYEKLLYFQQQLEKQHEELNRLGVQVPAPKEMRI